MDAHEVQCEIAWAAGLFEGEGCLTWNLQRSGRRYPHAKVVTTDRDVLERFARIMGIGNVTGPRFAAGRKPIWMWRAVGPMMLARVEETIGPWLGERRRAKLDEMLAFEPCEPIGPHRFTEEGWIAVREVVEANGYKAKGTRNGRAKLTEEQVVEIRASSATPTEIARKYPISRTQVRRIRAGSHWR